ncbi:hypothetical protein M3215_03725 [Bacillus cytotoxicus]|uniref:Uncharacterized protein n=1 Tax=Bacillus cytotoxicus TaxID=580165 RepID=A0ACC6A247_9BACI|nr:hypothetical protein [Bacillus cytotoxicus]
MALLTGTTKQNVNKKFKIKEIYELSPYAFEEYGNIKVTLQSGEETIGNMIVKVKE